MKHSDAGLAGKEIIASVTGYAYAKINISLDILSKMDDGFHYLESIMQTVGLCDEITIEQYKPHTPESVDVAVETNIPYIPNDWRNIAATAAMNFFACTDIKGIRLKIRIKKNIPICAGLGGGSADAACVLRVLNDIFETGLGVDKLEEIGYRVGADVPFCIEGGTKLARGRGEILQELPPIPQCSIVICKPPYSVSTPELFSRVDCRKIHIRPDTEGIIRAIEGGSLEGVAKRMYNVFEDIIHQGNDDINAIKSMMLDEGALGTVMTGTGPTVIGIFFDNVHAENAHEKLKVLYKDCFLTEPINT